MDADFTAYLDRVRAHRAELGESLSALDAALLAPVGLGGERWRDRVQAALAELRHDFADHVELTEAEGGLYADITEKAPRLSARVQVLLTEHNEIAELCDATLDRVQHAEPGSDVSTLREELTGLMGRIARHRQRGSDLVYEAYVVDLGGLG
jgi:sugar phosphate isomerase/epimerase